MRSKKTVLAPSWLDNPNPEWCGNYNTRFWDTNWQKVLFGRKSGGRKSYLDRIIYAGFDGVYLDIIDGVEYWEERRGIEGRRQPGRDMANLVEKISSYARVRRNRKDFIVVPQNGAAILTRLSPVRRQRYFDAIDGIGAEDTFYFGNKDEDNSFKIQPAFEHLKQFPRQPGKLVLSVDYLRDPEKVSDYQLRACEAGFIPQVNTRALDSLQVQTLGGCATPP
jgi:cysteinyl-tRNA synthetase